MRNMIDNVFIHVGGVLASSCANAEITDGTISPTVMARAGTGGNQLPLVVYRIEENGSCTDQPESDGCKVRTVGGRHCSDADSQMRDGWRSCTDGDSIRRRAEEHSDCSVGCFQNTGRGWWNEGRIAETLRTPCGGDSMKANLVAVMINNGTETDN